MQPIAVLLLLVATQTKVDLDAPTLGIRTASVADYAGHLKVTLPVRKGLIATYIDPLGPADDLITENSVITSINDVPVNDREDLREAMKKLVPGFECSINGCSASDGYKPVKWIVKPVAIRKYAVDAMLKKRDGDTITYRHNSTPSGVDDVSLYIERIDGAIPLKPRLQVIHPKTPSRRMERAVFITGFKQVPIEFAKGTVVEDKGHEIWVGSSDLIGRVSFDSLVELSIGTLRTESDRRHLRESELHAIETVLAAYESLKESQ